MRTEYNWLNRSNMLIVLLVALLMNGCHGGAFEIATITIQSGRCAGFACTHPPLLMETIIIREDSRYLRKGEAIDGQLVSALQKVIDRPSVAAVNVQDLGITAAWLKENIDSAWEEDIPEYLARSASKEKLFRSAFLNTGLIRNEVKDNFKGDVETGLHSAAHIRVDVLMEGSHIILESSSLQLYMLPWQISRNGETTRTYDPTISKVVARLLPEEFSNRTVLMGENLRQMISSVVLEEIQKEWNLIDSEERIGSYLKKVRKRYNILESEIVCLYSYDVGDLESSFCDTWNALLHKNSFPPNVVVGVNLAYIDGGLKGFQGLMSRLDAYVGLALSVPWLVKILESNPDLKLEIRFVDGYSLGKKTFEEIIDKWRKQGRDDYVQRFLKNKRRLASLELQEGSNCYSRWVVFPERDMMLLKYRCNPVSRYETSVFSPWNIHRQDSFGIWVTPEGEVNTPRWGTLPDKVR